MRLALYGLIALAILGTLSGIAYKIYSAGRNAEALAVAEKARQLFAQEERRGYNEGKRLEEARAKRRVVYRTITEEVEKVVERPVYRDICLPDDGLRIANDALRGASSSAGKPGGAVPGPDAARGREPSGGPSEDRRGQ